MNAKLKVPSYEGTIDNLEIYGYYGCKYPYKGINSKIIRFLAKTFKKQATKIGLKRIFKLYSKIGIDLFCVPINGLIPIIQTKSGFIDEMGREFKIYKDPKYNIETIYYTNGVFKTFEDYKQFPKPKADAPLKKYIFNISKKLERKYNVFAGFLVLGVFESVWQSFGLENFVRLSDYEKKKIIKKRGVYLLDQIIQIAKWNDFKKGIIFISDDYGYKNGLFMNPEFYREYIIPSIRSACYMAHIYNLKVIMHSCGDIYEIFDDLVKAGIDAIHPIEPTTANPDYDIFKLHEKYGDKICFIGNVSPQDLAEKEPEYIYNYTMKLLEELYPNLILSSGHSINPAVKLDNFLAMRKALEDYNQK